MLDGGNRFDSNTYRVAGPAKRFWAWGESVTWEEFRAAGQEARGALEPAER